MDSTDLETLKEFLIQILGEDEELKERFIHWTSNG
jgi:hypothetical protein